MLAKSILLTLTTSAFVVPQGMVAVPQTQADGSAARFRPTASSREARPISELPQPTSHALWIKAYDTPQEMVNGVDVIATGSVVETALGRSVMTHRGETKLQFELVTIQLDSILKSSVAATADVATGRLTIERLASLTLGGQSSEPDFEGGAIDKGRRQLFFLSKQDAAPFHYFIAMGEGRFGIGEGDALLASKRGSVADALHGTSLAELRTLVGSK